MIHVFELIGGRWFYNNIFLDDATKDAQNLFASNLKQIKYNNKQKPITKIVICHV